jgi:outer membrane protein
VNRGWKAVPLVLAAGLLIWGPVAPVSAQIQTESRTLTLDEVLRTAMDANLEIRRARLELEEANQRVREAWGNLYPQVDASAQYIRNISPPATFLPAIIFDPNASPDDLIRIQFGADNQWSHTLGMEQILFQGQAFVGVGAAARFRELQEETFRGAAHGVVTRVRILYYDLLLAQEQARLVERSLERVLESLAETRALGRAGLASDYDVLRLEVELANLEPRLRRAVNEARQRERELVTELAFPDETRIRVAGDLARMELDDPGANEPANEAVLRVMGVPLDPGDEGDPGVDRLVARALEQSATLRQAESNVALRRAELRAEQADYLPRVTLFASYDIAAQQDGSPTFFGRAGQRGYGRIVGVRVSVPVFTGFQRRARTQQRQAALRAAGLDRDLLDHQLRDRIRSLVEQVEEARHRARGQRLAVGQARRGFEIASAQYREGIGSQLELTDAEVALRESEFNLAEAVHEYLSARARLDEAVGQVPVPGI